MASPTNDEANDLADEILSREEFLAAREAGFFERNVERVLEAIADFLGRIFGALFGGAGGAAGTVFAIVLLTVAGLVLVYAIVKAITGRTAKEAVQDESGPRIVFDEVVEANELREQLAQRRASGDWRGAVIAGFRLAVVGLIDARIAREVAGATTGDFARAVELRRPELLDAYHEAARSFERAFYSDLAVAQSDLESVDALVARLDAVGAP